MTPFTMMENGLNTTISGLQKVKTQKNFFWVLFFLFIHINITDKGALPRIKPMIIFPGMYRILLFAFLLQ